jgi:hypothetical protein
VDERGSKIKEINEWLTSGERMVEIIPTLRSIQTTADNLSARPQYRSLTSYGNKASADIKEHNTK